MNQTPHLAMLPSPGMGHIIPMVEFAKKLISHSQNSLSITLIIPDSGLHSAEQKPFLDSLSIQPCIDLIYLPKSNLDDLEGDGISIVSNTVLRSLPFIRDVLDCLVLDYNLVALVVDLFGSALFNMARKVKVPPYLFFSSSASTLSFFLHLPELNSSVSELPEKWSIAEGRRFKMAEGIIVNTFQEMENGPINALQKNEKFPPIYPVGPLVRTDGEDDHEFNPTMKWLEQQPHASVLFVSFGSLGSLTRAQVYELALGLEMSENRFIWVIRDHPDEPFLPDGFVERTKERGLVVLNWVPQARILAHESTGGFVTHCGWNSVLESVVNGVPMIAWPLQSDQWTNADLLTSEDLKIAMKVCETHEKGLVIGRNEVALCVKKLMEGDEGKAVLKRTKAVMEAAKMAVRDGGASTQSLADLVFLWKLKKPDLVCELGSNV